MCLFHVRKIWNKWQIHKGKEGCLCGWKGIGCVRNVPSDSHQGLLTENTRRLCNGCLYCLSYPSTSVSPCPRAVVMEGDTGPKSCDPSVLLELPMPRRELANCTAAGMAEFFILISSCWPCYKRAGRDLKLECFTSKSIPQQPGMPVAI